MVSVEAIATFRRFHKGRLRKPCLRVPVLWVGFEEINGKITHVVGSLHFDYLYGIHRSRVGKKDKHNTCVVINRVPRLTGNGQHMGALLGGKTNNSAGLMKPTYSKPSYRFIGVGSTQACISPARRLDYHPFDLWCSSLGFNSADITKEYSCIWGRAVLFRG